MVAPLLIPKVSPPIPKKNTRNKPLNKPEEMLKDRAIPPITPPIHLSEECLFIREKRFRLSERLVDLKILENY